MNATHGVNTSARIQLLLRRLASITQEARAIKEDLALEFSVTQRRLDRIRAAHVRHRALARHSRSADL